MSSEALPRINESALVKYARAEIRFDFSSFSDNEYTALEKLRQASSIMDELFMLQVSDKSYSQWQSEIANIEDEAARATYQRFFDINMGIWDRLSEHVHEITEDNPVAKALGANFYPSDLTVEEFRAWVEGLSPEEQQNAKGFFSIIRRDESGSLKSIPYNEAYSQHLNDASNLLNEAADLVENESLQTFLRSRAAAFLSNEYATSDIDWLNLNADSMIDVTIGPYEVYEDNLLNQKAAFESFLAIKDPESSDKLQLFASVLQELEDNLPCDDVYKNKAIVEGKPIVVVDQVGFGGDRGGPQTAAFNLPNDEKVTNVHGNKLVILRNIQQAKFEKVLTPIADIVIEDSQRHLVNFEAFFNHILCHEMCHSLGPHSLDPAAHNGASSVREALGVLHSTLEEGKADIAGLYSLLYLMKRGLFDASQRESVLVTFLASTFRSIRFGLNEAHGKGIAIQLNWIIDEGGFVYNEETKKFSVVSEKCDDAIASLTREILHIQGDGDAARGQALLDRLCLNRDYTAEALDRLTAAGVPVDIQPVYIWERS